MAILSHIPAPLPLNFPQTFLPNRQLLAKLLAFSANNGSGNKETISAATGIPTGKSTGKVNPMIYYAQGMNLIRYMGKVILREDPFLSELQTLWLLHLMLCRRYGLVLPARGIADPWFALFSDSGFRLGHCFTQTDYLAFLKERHGDESKGYLKSLTGVVLRSYLEESCLGNKGTIIYPAKRPHRNRFFSSLCRRILSNLG